jgi:hypothetical protein
MRTLLDAARIEECLPTDGPYEDSQEGAEVTEGTEEEN